MIKLKTIRYFGRFYEFKGQLGWLPLHKALFVMIIIPDQVNWVPQNRVKFQ